MKKEINKIVLFLGFLTTVAGVWVSAFTDYVRDAITLTMIAAVLAIAFVNASNNVLKTVGYSLSAVLGAIGLDSIILMFNSKTYIISTGTFVTSIGMVIMSLGTLIYFVVFVLNFFGFVKTRAKNAPADAPCLYNELSRYKEMLGDGILTEEEFSELKQKAMDGADMQVPSMDDLKKWKRLLDQQVITQEEFASIKKNIFAK